MLTLQLVVLGFRTAETLFLLMFVAMAGWITVAMFKMPHRIEEQDDGTYVLVSPLKRYAIRAEDIESIRPVPNQIGILRLDYRGGRVTLLNQFDGFHEFIASLKSKNPSVELKGV